MWIEPIYDRTEEDIINKTSKGYLNAVDMNRIEGNIKYLADEMSISCVTKEWDINSIPTFFDFKRIIDNIKDLENNVYHYIHWNLPEQPVNNYTKLNAIEQILKNVKDDYMAVKDAYMRCGDDNYSGNELI